jgi:hypothetical protein
MDPISEKALQGTLRTTHTGAEIKNQVFVNSLDVPVRYAWVSGDGSLVRSLTGVIQAGEQIVRGEPTTGTTGCSARSSRVGSSA